MPTETIETPVETTTQEEAGAVPAESKKERPPTIDELMAEIGDLKKSLKSANRESMERRQKLDAFEKAEADKKKAEMSEGEVARAELAERVKELETLKAENLSMKREKTISRVLAGTKFKNDTARNDALEMLARTEAEPDDEKAYKVALDEILKVRPHWLDSVTPPSTDANEKGRNQKTIRREDINDMLPSRLRRKE